VVCSTASSTADTRAATSKNLRAGSCLRPPQVHGPVRPSRHISHLVAVLQCDDARGSRATANMPPIEEGRSPRRTLHQPMAEQTPRWRSVSGLMPHQRCKTQLPADARSTNRGPKAFQSPVNGSALGPPMCPTPPWHPDQRILRPPKALYSSTSDDCAVLYH
jgi:hypothetical protein